MNWIKIVALRMKARITEAANNLSLTYTKIVNNLPIFPKTFKAQVINDKLPVDLYLHIYNIWANLAEETK